MSTEQDQHRGEGGLSARHVWLVGLYHMRFSVRTGGGVVFLLLLLLVGIVLGAVIISPIESQELMQQTELTKGELARMFYESDEIADVVEYMTGSDDTESDYLLREQPGLLSAILILLLYFVPYLAAVGAFNQTAGDIGSGGLRYLLLRTERPNIFLGRFLGSLLFAAVSAAFLVAVVAAYVQLNLGIYPVGKLWFWALQGFLAIGLVFLPHIAICSFVSGILRSAFGSLVLCIAATVVPILFLWIARLILKANDVGPCDWLMRLLPWGWKFDLLASGIGTRLLGAGMMIGFTALFLSVGLLFFRRRDL